MATYSQATGYELRTLSGTLVAATRLDLVVPGTNEWAFIAGVAVETGLGAVRYEKYRLSNLAGFIEAYIDELGANIGQSEWVDYFQQDNNVNDLPVGVGSQVISIPQRIIKQGEKMALNNSGAFTPKYKVWYYHFKNNVQI